MIYKEGCEGINKLESIEGIEIELLNGYKALVFPKYKELPLLYKKKIENWGTSELTVIQAIKVIDGKALTDELLNLDSPAAEFVRQFGKFDLPPLLAAAEIAIQKEDIDALAGTIKGADLLLNYDDCLWSCCRESSYCARCANGFYGYFSNNYVRHELSVVPTKIYK